MSPLPYSAALALWEHWLLPKASGSSAIHHISPSHLIRQRHLKAPGCVSSDRHSSAHGDSGKVPEGYQKPCGIQWVQPSNPPLESREFSGCWSPTWPAKWGPQLSCTANLHDRGPTFRLDQEGWGGDWASGSFLLIFSNSERTLLCGKAWKPPTATHTGHCRLAGVVMPAGMRSGALLCLEKAAGSYLHSPFSELQSKWFIYTVHTQSLGEATPKSWAIFFLIYFSFLWKKIAHG